MTVRELRRALFEIENQEAEVFVSVDGDEMGFVVEPAPFSGTPVVFLTAR